MGKLIGTIGFVISFALAILFSTLWMKALKHQLQPQLVKNLPSNSVDHEYVAMELGTKQSWIVGELRTIGRDIFQLKSIQSIILMLAIYLFGHFAVKSLLEFIAESFPLINLTKINKCLNNIVDSFLLFTTILAFLILPMFITNYQIDQQLINRPNDPNPTLLQSQKYSQRMIFLLLETYLYGRILFSMGYIIGTLVKIQAFRSFGVALSLISIIVALSYTYNFDIFVYY